MTNIEIMDRLAQGNKSNWAEKAQWRKDNEHWLKRSAKLAMKILLRLKECGMTQKELAERMGVSAQYISKLLKGNENMSLETIGRIESLLDMQLLEIVDDCHSKDACVDTFADKQKLMIYRCTERSADYQSFACNTDEFEMSVVVSA